VRCAHDRRADARALSRRQGALEKGRHLLIEKPIATTLAEADELLGDRRADRGHRADRPRRAIQPAVRAALPFVEAPRFIDSDRLAPFNPRGSDVAVVLDLMIHDIDLVLTLVGVTSPTSRRSVCRC
jgi:predicted dehydrogenase